jgi:hypothetical protein
LQGDLFQLHKRLVDLQEDSLPSSMGKLPLDDWEGSFTDASHDDSIPDSAIRGSQRSKRNEHSTVTTSFNLFGF